MSYRFTALTNFDVNSLFERAREGERVEHSYCKGLGYTVRDGNTRLHAAVERWVRDGIVTLGDATMVPDEASVDGAGNVK